MKKAAKIFIVTALLLFLFKGPLFRLLITYHDIGSRTIIALTDQHLMQAIDNEIIDNELSIDAIIEVASKLTTTNLSFTTGKASADPNELATNKSANCVGYAAMFNAIASYMIKKQGTENEYEVQHKIGKLYFLGFDLHQYSGSPFFKDHDYNIIRNKITKEEVAVDASVADYLWVERVSAVAR